MPSSALLPGKPYAAGARVAAVESLFAHIYREASVTKHAPLITIPFESRLEVVAEPKEDGRWLQVRLPDDRAGWVQAGDITLEPRRLTIAETLEFSKRFLGLPYTWAALRVTAMTSGSPKCSAGGGLSLPRDARRRPIKGSVAVPRKVCSPATCCISARREEDQPYRIYMGDGKFINATRT
jgi:hypothetical protein